MPTIIYLAGLLLPAAAMAIPNTQPAFPHRILEDGRIKALIYLPDAKQGYYRGARFDWSGMIARVEYKGHTFYAPWKSTHDPGNHDDLTGPASEFGLPGGFPGPLGYKEAKFGETFVKIGVGELRKPDEPKYAFDTRYEIVKPGLWKVTSGDGWIQFDQDFAAAGWAYQYTKRIQLLKGDAGFDLFHRLKNTGTRPIETAYYNHNFTKIDDTPVGAGYRLIFPFTPRPIEKELDPPARFSGREIVFDGPIADGKSLWVAFDGFKAAADNAVTIRNDKTGAEIRITGDETPMRFVYWGMNTCACPETFIPINLAPGAEKTWKIRYVFAVDR